MRGGSKFVTSLLVASAICLTSLAYSVEPVSANHPCDPPNVIPGSVCNMDRFRGAPPRQIPEGWNEFVLAGDPAFMQDVDTFWGPPSLRIWTSGGTFKAGIHTHVNVSPGAGYRASIAWGAPTSPETFGRQLGIDPTGGSDPNSPNIIWGPMHWGPGRILNYPPPDVNIDVRARAQGETMTVFFLVDHPQVVSNDLIFIDAISLFPDESAPAVELPAEPEPAPAEPELVPAEPVQAAALPPQPTPIPPTAVPTQTPTPTATPTSTATPTPTATATPSPTPTATATATPTWMPLPTVTPDTTALDVTRLTQIVSGNNSPTGRILLALGALGFGGATVFGSALMWVRRKQDYAAREESSSSPGAGSAVATA